MEYPEKITHAELIELGRDWLIKSYSNMAPHGHYGCSVVVTELSTATWSGEIPDVLGFCPYKSILIECKASRSDFNADKNKPFREHPEMGIGLQRWYMAPLGVIPQDKVPEKWGLLEVTDGRSILVTKEAELQERNFDSEIIILLSLMRRLKITPDKHIAIKRYKKLRGMPESKNRATFFIDQEKEEEVSHESVIG
jgi:hypothetical protein